MKNSVIKVYSENKQSFNIKGLANELLEHAKRYHEYNDKGFLSRRRSYDKMFISRS